MIDLFQEFSIQSIILFVIFLAIAIKGVVTFFDWASKRTKEAIKKAEKPEQLKNNIQDHEQAIMDLKDCIEKLTDKVDLLMQSDKDAIKAFIVKQHHYFYYQLKEIDDQSLQCIQRRYEHYKAEGGNTYVKDLMFDLRNLPRSLPETMKKNNQK